jgi:DNA invertase Pin-like site-specific DNA recombinase
MSEAPRRAFGYTRVSTMGQVKDGDGLGMQAERVRGWCQFAGYDPPELFIDEGVSGMKHDRPGLRAAMRAAVLAGDGAALVVYKLDRLGRNALDVQEALALLLDAKVRVVAIADGVDSGSGMGATLLKLLTSILASFAELEHATITERLQGGRARANAQQRAYTSEPAYGRRRVADSKALEADAGELAAAECARALRAKRLTLRAIGAELLAEGHRPRRAATWSPVVVRRLIDGKREPAPPKKSDRLAAARARLLGTTGEAPSRAAG